MNWIALRWNKNSLTYPIHRLNPTHAVLSMQHCFTATSFVVLSQQTSNKDVTTHSTATIAVLCYQVTKEKHYINERSFAIYLFFDCHYNMATQAMLLYVSTVFISYGRVTDDIYYSVECTIPFLPGSLPVNRQSWCNHPLRLLFLS